jgi:RNA-directed DNA polymerase
MPETSRSESVSTRLQQIAKRARDFPDSVWTTLAHHIDVDFLREAFGRTRKDGATGVDGQTAADYEVNLEANLRDLLDRFKSGTYFAPPVKRVHIPKGDGRTRPIGIPTFEDKVLQRAVVMVLESIYEQDFKECSYGFRPGRSAHQALLALWKALMDMGGGWVLEVDIQSFFDSVDHGHLRGFLDLRVRDGVIRRAIDKWLKAGVMEDGSVRRSEEGTPQGGVISPLLANVYLHEVIDKWFDSEVRPRLRGSATLIRYADDFVIAFESEDDARRVLKVLPLRLGKFGLTLHPTKTRLVEFNRPRADGPRPGSFDLLGFTHFWGRSRKGTWIVKKKTAASSFRRALRKVADWCAKHRHQSLRDQHAALSRKLRGHYAYFGTTGNADHLSRFRERVRHLWQKCLNRRSQSHSMPWERFELLEKRYLLPPIVVVASIYRRAANP